MKKFDVFASEGGYRYAGGIWADGPVMGSANWFATREEAETAASAAAEKWAADYKAELEMLGLTESDLEE